jgi:hypothetical protein
MLPTELPRVAPASVPVGELTRTEPPTLEFEGWTKEAFAILDRLRETPHIDQYKKEKPGISPSVKEPFKRYRNDLVVNWVLPSRLQLETEKYVFSRLLKNDFGAGGCHDNLWMAFYRPHTKRLRDVQISHRISPDGFGIGLYVGAYATDLLKQVQARIESQPAVFLDRLNLLLQSKKWTFGWHKGSGDGARRPTFATPLASVPDDLMSADGIWLRHRIDRGETLRLGPDLVPRALDRVFDLWPLYRFYLAGSPAA